MQLSGAPAKIVEAFAVNGNKRTVPVPSQIPITPGAASFNDGFPPLNATAVPSGGIPPSILDMNGVLNQVSAPAVWMNAGGVFPYDPTFSSAIGGYPKGARVMRAINTGMWISIIDNNTTDPDSGGAGWIPDRATASVYASAQQTLASGTPKILWDTVEFDTFGLWNGTSKVFQVLWAGNYRISGSVYLPAAAAQLYGTQVWKNGALARNCIQYPQVSDGDMTYSFDTIVPCAVSDQISAILTTPSSSTLAGVSGSNQAYVYGQLEYLGV